MKKQFLTLICAIFSLFASAQNVGIGTTNPEQRLDVNGNIKANALQLSNGSKYDILTKVDSVGNIGYKKGHGGLGLNYIIALGGTFPSQSGTSYNSTFFAEIKLFAGNFAPNGWAFCHGQLLPINQHQALFSLLGTTYGGNGQTNFALPDLRGATPVQQGTSTAGVQWNLGDRSN